MAKKKRRTAKQRAATKKMIAARKAQLRKKKKTTRRKTRRKKVRATRKRNITRRGPPKRARKRRALKKSHLWIVFKCKGNSVWWASMSAGKPVWRVDKGAAMLFRTKTWAQKFARQMAKKRISSGANVGAVNTETTAAQIKAYCGGK